MYPETPVFCGDPIGPFGQSQHPVAGSVFNQFPGSIMERRRIRTLKPSAKFVALTFYSSVSRCHLNCRNELSVASCHRWHRGTTGNMPFSNRYLPVNMSYTPLTFALMSLISWRNRDRISLSWLEQLKTPGSNLQDSWPLGSRHRSSTYVDSAVSANVMAALYRLISSSSFRALGSLNGHSMTINSLAMACCYWITHCK